MEDADWCKMEKNAHFVEQKLISFCHTMQKLSITTTSRRVNLNMFVTEH